MKYLKFLFILVLVATINSFSQHVKQYVSEVNTLIKNHKLNVKEGKMNCLNQWQKIYTDANGKVLKAVGGLPIDCYQFEKIMYLKNDSAVYYEELYHPIKTKECKTLESKRFSYLIENKDLNAFDELASKPLTIDSPAVMIRNLNDDCKGIYFDLHSMCYEPLTPNELYQRTINSKIIKKEILPQFCKKNTENLGELFVYKLNNEVVLLKTLYKADTLETSLSIYFKDNQLIDYSSDLLVIVNDSVTEESHDRFKVEGNRIRNFEYLQLKNTKYEFMTMKEVLELLNSEADLIKQKAIYLIGKQNE